MLGPFDGTSRCLHWHVVVPTLLVIVIGPGPTTAEGQKIYWTLTSEGKIQRADLDASNIEDLLTGLDQPGSINLDIVGGQMVWKEAGDRFVRADLDGSNLQHVLTAACCILGFAVDPTGGKMYWGARDPGRVARANLDGSDVEELITGLDTPIGFAIDPQEKLYFTGNEDTEALIGCMTVSAGQEAVIMAVTLQPFAMVPSAKCKDR